jgi:ribosomal protein S18 acetylase RimI-like enzyme
MGVIRKAFPEDANEFAELVLISAPYFPVLFGKKIRTILQYLFCQPRNLFSHEHTCFAEINSQRAGMILSYDWRAKAEEDFRTGLLFMTQMKFNFLARLPLLLKFNKAVGGVKKGEFYISNVATLPQYQGRGVGTALIAKAEQKAKQRGAGKMVLDVEKENLKAIKLYKQLSYEIIQESSVQLGKGEVVDSYRMSKALFDNGDRIRILRQ